MTKVVTGTSKHVSYALHEERVTKNKQGTARALNSLKLKAQGENGRSLRAKDVVIDGETVTILFIRDLKAKQIDWPYVRARERKAAFDLLFPETIDETATPTCWSIFSPAKTREAVTNVGLTNGKTLPELEKQGYVLVHDVVKIENQKLVPPLKIPENSLLISETGSLGGEQGKVQEDPKVEAQDPPPKRTLVRARSNSTPDLYKKSDKSSFLPSYPKSERKRKKIKSVDLTGLLQETPQTPERKQKKIKRNSLDFAKKLFTPPSSPRKHTILKRDFEQKETPQTPTLPSLQQTEEIIDVPIQQMTEEVDALGKTPEIHKKTTEQVIQKEPPSIPKSDLTPEKAFLSLPIVFGSKDKPQEDAQKTEQDFEKFCTNLIEKAENQKNIKKNLTPFLEQVLRENTNITGIAFNTRTVTGKNGKPKKKLDLHLFQQDGSKIIYSAAVSALVKPSAFDAFQEKPQKSKPESEKKSGLEALTPRPSPRKKTWEPLTFDQNQFKIISKKEYDNSKAPETKKDIKKKVKKFVKRTSGLGENSQNNLARFLLSLTQVTFQEIPDTTPGYVFKLEKKGRNIQVQFTWQTETHKHTEIFHLPMEKLISTQFTREDVKIVKKE